MVAVNQIQNENLFSKPTIVSHFIIARMIMNERINFIDDWFTQRELNS